MKLNDIRLLGDWIYHLRPLIKAYQGNPDLMVDLIAGSLMHRIKNSNPDLHGDAQEEFWGLARMGPFEPGD